MRSIPRFYSSLSLLRFSLSLFFDLFSLYLFTVLYILRFYLSLSLSQAPCLLAARHYPAKEEEENPAQSQEIPETNLRTSSSLPPTNKNPPSIAISDDSSEAKSSAPPVQSPPPATAAADASSNSGSLSSSDDPPAKRDKYNRLSRRTFKSNKKTTTESSSTNSGKFGFVDDLSSVSLSSDTTSNDLAGAPTTKMENLRIEDNDDGWRDRRSSPWRRSAAAEKVAAQPQLLRRGSLEDEAGSSWSDGSHRRQGSELQRAMAPPKRRHCRAVAGAAPIVLCNSCEELLQLPADFLLFPGRRRLRCGSCSKILAFWFAAGGRLRPARGGHN